MKNKKEKIFILLISITLFAGLIYYYQFATDDHISTGGTDLPSEIIDPFDNTNESLVSSEVISPSGTHTSRLEGNSTGLADLYIDDNEIDSNIIHTSWSSSNELFYVQLDSLYTNIKKYNPEGKSQDTLISIPRQMAGFEIVGDSLIYATESEIGYIKQDGSSKRVLLEFKKPYSGADTAYVPNIIPSEDKSSVTVEIQDENYLETKRVRYLVVNSSGVVESDAEVVL